MVRAEKKRLIRRERKALRVRRRARVGSTRPRLSVFRSLTNIYAQVIDDTVGITLVSASTIDNEIVSQVEGKSKIEAARVVGKVVAERARNAGITTVVFDRGGYRYHGRVAALAAGAREAGLEF